MRLRSAARLAQRHGLPVVQALPYELFVRLYRKPLLRAVLKRFFPRRKPQGLIFVVGCYNAGTTVVKDAIAMHPDVASAPIEGDVLTGQLSNFEDGDWPRAMFANAYLINQHRGNDRLDADALLSDWRPWIRQGRFFIEKSISLSVRMSLLRQAFPGSRFVCVVRSPDAVVSGIKKRSVPRGAAREFVGADTYPDEFLLRQWAFIYRLILTDAKAEDTLFVAYEDFVSRPDHGIRSIHGFLGLADVPVRYLDGELVVGDSVLAVRPPRTPAGTAGDPVRYLEETLASIESTWKGGGDA